jgi:surface polysaccharide O-acyltransferase-like enzyme
MGPSPRNQVLDVLKLVSAMAVIWIHAADSESGKLITIFCRFAVPFFSAVLAYYATSAGIVSDARWGLVRYGSVRFNRIYLPFIVWSLLYLGFRRAKHEISPDGSPIVLGWSSFLCGTTHHLWFLPFAFFASVLFFGVGRLFRKVVGTLSFVVGSAFVCLFLGVGILSTKIQVDLVSNPVSYFLFYACDALPAAILGSAIRLLGFSESRRSFRVGAAFIFVASLLLLKQFGYNAMLSALAGAALLQFGFLSKEILVPNWVSAISGLSLGIYAVHLVFVEGFQFVFQRLKVGPGLAVDFWVFTLGLVLSIASCVTLARFKILRPLVH